jgi:hypothetical protein
VFLDSHGPFQAPAIGMLLIVPAVYTNQSTVIDCKPMNFPVTTSSFESTIDPWMPVFVNLKNAQGPIASNQLFVNANCLGTDTIAFLKKL